MIDWQPIETAPKDGTHILVYTDIATVDVVHIAFWVEDEHDMWRDQGFDSKAELIGWWSYTRNSVSQDKLDEWRTPTHWAPYNPPVTA
ncbi:hypothetical protein FF80_03330 [Devosia sp. LC5]|uniref:hypothetical protein n=1 Tax=Devosia sp. LC5 TaxID=1502724 RepID=UPI0004E434DF|nr:hypothetical protein [Devosia sp. LC5]KFC62763.1 hypothetical protein FF80_03330 [Devosia sp. LC5]